jgi:hypothetical protein
MLLLLGIPLLLIAMFAVIFVISLIVGFILLRSRRRRLAPFFFFVPTFAAEFAILLACETFYLTSQTSQIADPDAEYFRALLGFPIGAFFGLCVGLIPALVLRRVMTSE